MPAGAAVIMPSHEWDHSTAKTQYVAGHMQHKPTYRWAVPQRIEKKLANMDL